MTRHPWNSGCRDGVRRQQALQWPCDRRRPNHRWQEKRHLLVEPRMPAQGCPQGQGAVTWPQGPQHYWKGAEHGRTPRAGVRAQDQDAGASQVVGTHLHVLVLVLSPTCLGWGPQPGTVTVATMDANSAAVHTSPPHLTGLVGGEHGFEAAKSGAQCHRDAPGPGTAVLRSSPYSNQTPVMEKPLPCSRDGTERQDRPSPGTSNWSNWFSWVKVEHGESQWLKPVPRCV